jgi:hypothetical protein
MSGHEASGGQCSRPPEDTPAQHQRRPSPWPVRWRHNRAVMTDRDLQARPRITDLCGRWRCGDQVPAMRICATLRVAASQWPAKRRLPESLVSQGSLRSRGCW